MEHARDFKSGHNFQAGICVDLAPAGKGLGCGAPEAQKSSRRALRSRAWFGESVRRCQIPRRRHSAGTKVAKRALTATAAHRARIILSPRFCLEPAASFAAGLAMGAVRSLALVWSNTPDCRQPPLTDNLSQFLTNPGRISKKPQGTDWLAYSRFPIICKSFLPHARLRKIIRVAAWLRKPPQVHSTGIELNGAGGWRSPRITACFCPR